MNPLSQTLAAISGALFGGSIACVINVFPRHDLFALLFAVGGIVVMLMCYFTIIYGPIRAGEQLRVGLAWDENDSLVLDLDLSAVLFDASMKEIDAVYFGKKTTLGMELNGDDVTGAVSRKTGEEFDEIITVDLSKIQPDTEHIFITTTLKHPPTKTLDQVKGLHCQLHRRYDWPGDLVSHHELTEPLQIGGPQDGKKSGCIVAMLSKAGSHWDLKSLGKYVDARRYKDMINTMQSIVNPDLVTVSPKRQKFD